MLDIAKHYAYKEYSLDQPKKKHTNPVYKDKNFIKEVSTNDIMKNDTSVGNTSKNNMANKKKANKTTLKNDSPSLVKTNLKKTEKTHPKKYQLGDSVIVYPQKILGLVYEPNPTTKGEIGVQIRGKKQLINHKRIKLKTSASDLYPADYDFSIIFDSVELRKTRYQTNRVYRENTSVNIE